MKKKEKKYLKNGLKVLMNEKMIKKIIEKLKALEPEEMSYFVNILLKNEKDKRNRIERKPYHIPEEKKDIQIKEGGRRWYDT